jgi:23S rRNA (cytidine1920-2'-O)/16S rRNA (cytidine1409-2'-O)-methyltransferase
MHPTSPHEYVSRGGEKLAAALNHFAIDVAGLICADLGSHVGGFVDCLLRRGAARVYAVDTSYGILAWKLRRDARVVVLERTNAMHVVLPEAIELVTIDVGWTKQARILPAAAGILKSGGCVVSLIKPHYEADADRLEDGVLPESEVESVVQSVLRSAAGDGWTVAATMLSPLAGHGGNREVFALLTRTDPVRG